jgi:nicotinate-nucleotide adenylyltransferase
MNARTSEATPGGIGILGGSFDPIHRGHLAIAADVAEAYGLARILFVPAHRSPLRGAPTVAAAERLRMCELAAADNPRFEVSGLELERPPPSYTRDTITEVQGRYPDRELTIIVGADLAEELEEWRAIEELLAAVRMVVVERPGAVPRDLAALAARLGVDAGRLQERQRAGPEISSTDIRARIAAGRPYADLVHPAVAGYIEDLNLYRTPER